MLLQAVRSENADQCSEALALHLVCALYEASDGSVQQWRVLAEMDGMTAEAIVFAACRRRRLHLPTEAGRRQVEAPQALPKESPPEN